MISIEEINKVASGAYSALHLARIKILQEGLEPLLGKTVMIERTLRDPISGDKSTCRLEATIIGGRWSRDDLIELRATYTHPYTGKLAETGFDCCMDLYSVREVDAVV